MSSTINGIDLLLDAPRSSFEPVLILEVVIDFWPESVYQGADDDAGRPVRDVLGDSSLSDPDEFFLYENDAIAQSWRHEGWTEGHGNRMLHYLIADHPSRPNDLQVTMVVDQLEGEVALIYRSLADEFARLATRSEQNAPQTRRINYEAELREVGANLTRAGFYQLVDDVRRRLYPGWTQDELACHPHDALQFCEATRAKIGAPVPDHIIMKAMLNRRKRQ